MDLEFLAVSADPNGARAATYVTAQSATEALRRLQEQGLKDVELCEDEATAVARWAALKEAERRGVTVPPRGPAAAAYAGRYVTVGRGARLLVGLQRKSLWVLVLFCTVILLNSTTWLGAVPYLVVVLALSVGLRLVTIRTELHWLFERVLTTAYLRQGKEALRALADFEKALKAVRALEAIGRIDLATLRASALAADHQREQALQALEAIRGEIGAPEWLYWLRRAGLHQALLELAEAKQAYDKAIELGPPCPTLHGDLAMLLALRLERGAEARQQLEEMRRLPPIEISRMLQPLIEGTVLLAEGSADSARDLLAKLSLPLATSLRPFADIAHVVQCLAAGAAGDQEAARRHLDAIEEVLVARDELELLRRCRRAAGRSAA